VSPSAGIQISVVVPTRDRPVQLQRCLLALAEHDQLDDVEVIVVDDGSTAQLEEVVATIPSPLVIQLLQTDAAGPAAARNTGARAASGRHVAFTDDDCIPDRRWLAAIRRRIAQAPEAVIGGPMAPSCTGNRCAETTQALLDYLYAHFNSVPGQARFLTSNNLVLPRELLLDAGGFDERFVIPAGEDRDLVARLAAHGHEIVFAQELVVRHDHPSTLRQFVRQNVRYGRGARRFRSGDEAGATSVHITAEPPVFYLRLVTHRLRAAGGGLPTTALLGVSQVSVALGYAAECVRPARR
jgi:GT2 family glycosyltransferase